MVDPATALTIGSALYQGAAGLFGKKKKKKQKTQSTLDPQQQQLYNDNNNSLYGNGPFSDLYKYDADAANENFDKNYSRPAYRNYQENVIPKITGQFRGGNIMNSTYAGEALARTGRDVQEGLDAKRSDMQFQGQQAALDRKSNAIDKTLGMSTFGYDKTAQNKPVIDQILESVGPDAAKWFSDYLNKTKGIGSGTAGFSGQTSSNSVGYQG